MSSDKLIASVLAVLVVATVFTPVATAATASQERAYAGSHIAFETTGNAVADYSVNDATVFQSVKVQSKSNVESGTGLDLGGNLTAVTGFVGAAVSVDATTETSATVTTESGAELTAHDNANGILVVRSGENGQVVAVNVSASSEAETTSEGRVVVTAEDGTKGAFIVVGDGDVTVNEAGNVTAELDSESKLVFRSYPEGRNAAAKQQERLIAEGTAAAEVHVMQRAEASGETAVDVVKYGQGTTVEVTEQTQSSVTMTAERSEHSGKVIITSVSEAMIESTDDLEVTVSGTAAVRASSYSDLKSAIGGDTSKFMVAQQSSAEASADVLVAVNHFSERQITMQDGGSSGGNEDVTTDGGDDGTSGSTGPGFGIAAALIAVIGTVFAATRYT